MLQERNTRIMYFGANTGYQTKMVFLLANYISQICSALAIQYSIIAYLVLS